MTTDHDTDTPTAAEPGPAPTALDMALNSVAAVTRYARGLSTDDPEANLKARIGLHAERAHGSAEMAANMALVSIAVDLHRLADIFARQYGEPEPALTSYERAALAVLAGATRPYSSKDLASAMMARGGGGFEHVSPGQAVTAAVELVRRELASYITEGEQERYEITPAGLGSHARMDAARRGGA